MSALTCLIQTITGLSALLPVLSSWENCTLDIVQKYRPPSVSIFCKSVAQCPTNQFYKMLYSPSQTLFGLEPHQLPALKDDELVVIPIHDGLFDWNNETVWNYRLRGRKNGFKLVVVANGSEDDLYSLGKLFKSLWASGIVNTVVLLQKESAIQVFTYIPFKNKLSCEDTSPVLLGNCSTALPSIFEVNEIENLNKCPMRIALVDDRPWFIRIPFSGRLVNLIHETERKLNFTIVTMSPSKHRNGGICGREEFLGTRGQVAKGEAHIAIGSFDRDECSVLEYIGLPYTQCYSWCTPILSGNNYVYLFLLRQFKPPVWAAIFASAVIVVISVLILCSASHERMSSNDAFNLAITVYAQPPSVDFQRNPVRIVVIVWLFTCLVVRSAYEGELKSQSAVPFGSHIIYDLNELDDRDLRLCSSLAGIQWMRNIDDPPMQRLSKKNRLCKISLYDSTVSAAKYNDRAVFTSDLRCGIISTEINPAKATLFPSTGGCIKMYQLTPIVTIPGSPFKKMLKKICQRCVEAGLIKKWMQIRAVRQELGTVRPYSVRHLFPALFVLALGCAVGGVIFLAENALHKWPCDKMKKPKRLICSKTTAVIKN